MTNPQASPPVGDDLIERDRLAVETWIAGGCSSWGVPVQSIQRIITPPSTPKVKEASVGEAIPDDAIIGIINIVTDLQEADAMDLAYVEVLERVEAIVKAATLSPQPATRGVDVEAALHKLIDAARMYEASCRLGGRDQEFAGLKLDDAKAAAIATIAPQLDVREFLEAFDDWVADVRSWDIVVLFESPQYERLAKARSTLSNVLGSQE
jgi:hypothetical protein